MSEPENAINDTETQASASRWQSKQVYPMALACLVLGVAVGYFLRGSQAPTQAVATSATVQKQSTSPHGMDNAAPTLEKMKQMADKTAAPVLEKLKDNPKDFDALNDAGKIYRASHQFKLAAEYYEKALDINPKNAAVRTDLASCLYYTGDVDGALAQLDKALSYDPNFYGALLNVGIIKLKEKNDAEGAIASWQKILKTTADPRLKEMVKRKIAETKERVASNEVPKA